MNIKAVLFDLDGTLLPMDQDQFLNLYFKGLSEKMFSYGYNPEKLIKSIVKGTNHMINNDGEKTNEEVFWESFSSNYDKDVKKDEPIFSEFYKNEFQNVKDACEYNQKANEVISFLKEKGYRLVLATNPFFPAVATLNRVKWAGLNKEDFELITTYENSHFCKPNLKYYYEILEKLKVKPEECLMVGNDVDEDMITEQIGMKVFLLTDCLLNKNNLDINNYPNGNFNELISFLERNLVDIK